MDKVPLLDIHSFGLSLILGTLEIFNTLDHYDGNGSSILKILSILLLSWKTKAYMFPHFLKVIEWDKFCPFRLSYERTGRQWDSPIFTLFCFTAGEHSQGARDSTAAPQGPESCGCWMVVVAAPGADHSLHGFSDTYTSNVWTPLSPNLMTMVNIASSWTTNIIFQHVSPCIKFHFA